MSRDDVLVMLEAVVKLTLLVLGGVAVYGFLKVSQEEFYALIDAIPAKWVAVLIGVSAGMVPISIAVWVAWCDGTKSSAAQITLNDKRQVLCCRGGREIPYSDLTVHIEMNPGSDGDNAYIPSEHWVYLRAAENRFNLNAFTEVQQAKDYARKIRMKVATGSSGTPWFPPDD